MGLLVLSKTEHESGLEVGVVFPCPSYESIFPFFRVIRWCERDSSIFWSRHFPLLIQYNRECIQSSHQWLWRYTNFIFSPWEADDDIFAHVLIACDSFRSHAASWWVLADWEARERAIVAVVVTTISSLNLESAGRIRQLFFCKESFLVMVLSFVASPSIVLFQVISIYFFSRTVSSISWLLLASRLCLEWETYVQNCNYF